MDDDVILKGLNPEQQKAVEHLNGPLLVLAGAGSGKTRVLTRRIAYLIDHYRVSPYNILAVTFTNKAAEEMKERVASLLDSLGGTIWVSTFHSFCVRILRRDITKIGYSDNFVIYDTSDQKTVVKGVFKELNIDPKRTKPAAVLAEISHAKNELISVEEYQAGSGDYFSQISAPVYQRYQDRLKENNALDFDDLIMKTVDLFREYPLVLEHYQERFKYISVDEYQDVNTAQYQLVHLLAAKYRNLCVVGDPDQGIYGFRGADIKNILNFEKDYTDTKIIKLEQNYRSKEKILEAAHSVIANNISRKEKKLWTDRGEGEDINLYVAQNEKDEASYICKSIGELLERGYNYGDIAILYRTNAQSRALEDSLVKYAIPYQIIGGLRFYDRMEIKDILAYLRVIYNSDDDISLQRIINRPKRGIGDGTIAKLERYASEQGISLYQAGLRAEEITDLTGAYQKRVKNFFSMMEEFREYAGENTVDRLTDKILKETSYKGQLEKQGTVEAKTRLENIQELFSVMQEFLNNGEDNSLAGFLEEVSLISDVDTMEDTEQFIVLMTFHAAKGLEFPVVFMIGMEEGIFPHANSMFEVEGIEEERRLCYVGITRAMEKLYLSRARERMRFGEYQANPPSQFLQEIPDELLIERDSIFNIDKVDEDPSNDKVVSTDKNRHAAKRQNYKVGDRVLHPKWGIGEVLEINNERSLELKIKFSRGKARTLLAEYAPIQKV
ncbi:DNA helicase PcrA [Halocella sp. SP3-1]|uniref:DNA helicase PcrA n=1 Tax=Halocella sp. SP3-1 TaxID=2382161 RepID=UPI000F757B24|nr:DNA helicase PcrA [Halocella sp. SP3-1]AZO96263.1 DNA helicase PcrA [Halocella sp. SP3-1]